MIFKVCPYCGAHLDCGERCDCQGAKKETALLQQKRSQAQEPIDSLSDRSREVKGADAGNAACAATGKEL